MKRYTVMLFYPDYAQDSGCDTYLAVVNADSPLHAGAEAQLEVDCEGQPGGDFTVLAVFEGEHHDIKHQTADACTP